MIGDCGPCPTRLRALFCADAACESSGSGRSTGERRRCASHESACRYPEFRPGEKFELSSIRSAIRLRTAARAAGEVVPHSSFTACAASRAVSTSAAEDRATRELHAIDRLWSAKYLPRIGATICANKVVIRERTPPLRMVANAPQD